MKKLTMLSLAFFLTLSMACKEESPESEDNNNATTGNCANGANFCFTLDGTTKSGDAELMKLSDRYRVYWTTGTGNDFEQIELDLYLSATGTFPIDESKSQGSAKAEYFSKAAGAFTLESGTITITQYDPEGAGVSGTFSGKSADGKEITNGNIEGVKMK